METQEIDSSVEDVVRAVVELLAPIGPVVAQPLLDSWGLYIEDRIFALVREGTVYFRTDGRTLRRYERAGSRPFVHLHGDGLSSVMPYHEVPETVLADRDVACAWAFDAAAVEP